METHDNMDALSRVDRTILWMRAHVAWTFGLGMVAGLLADAVGVLTYFWVTGVITFAVVSLLQRAEDRSPWVRIIALVKMRPHSHNEDGECIV